jgi:5-hydroxyisourate hydrolase-like protein (transthyretin family)
MRSAMPHVPATASTRRRAFLRLAPAVLVGLGVLGYAHHLNTRGSADAVAVAGVVQDVAPSVLVQAAPKRVGYDPRVTAADSQHALEATLASPAVEQAVVAESESPDPAPSSASGRFDPEKGGPVDTTQLDRVVPGKRPLGPVHVDPMPAGVTLAAPTDTQSLYARSGAVPMSADQLSAASAVPAGTSLIPGLGQHVAPSCTGTGTDGKRVQAMYLHEAGTNSRYTQVLSLLRNEVANVDDTYAVSSRKTGGDLRVRWVHDASCAPVILDVTVPSGSLGSDFEATISALENLGYNDPSRKYVAFADDNQFCGIGTVYQKDQATGNPNDGYAASYSRIDTNCWSTHESVAAHELTHNLGGVQRTAPHHTTYGHCYDESDLMCYDDSSGITMRSVCASSQAQLLDCNDDDYFNTDPAAGSYLATHWNVARSSFLDSVAGPGGTTGTTDPTGTTVTLSVPTEATAGTAFPVSVTATGQGPFTYDWKVSGPCTFSDTTVAAPTVTCTTAGQATVSVAVTQADGQSVQAGPVTVSVSPPDGTSTPTRWTSVSQVRGRPVRLTALLRDASTGAPTAGERVQLEAKYRGARGYVTVANGLVTDSSGRVMASPAVRRAGWFRFSYAGGASYTASVSRPTYVKVPTKLTLTTRPHGHKRLVTGQLTTLGGEAIPGAKVTLEQRTAGGPWAAVRTTRTDQHGRVIATVRPERRTSYRWTYRGASAHLDALSARITLRR